MGLINQLVTGKGPPCNCEWPYDELLIFSHHTTCSTIAEWYRRVQSVSMFDFLGDCDWQHGAPSRNDTNDTNDTNATHPSSSSTTQALGETGETGEAVMLAAGMQKNLPHRIQSYGIYGNIYMVTFTINIPQMLAYIPYMDPMGSEMWLVQLGPLFFIETESPRLLIGVVLFWGENERGIYIFAKPPVSLAPYILFIRRLECTLQQQNMAEKHQVEKPDVWNSLEENREKPLRHFRLTNPRFLAMENGTEIHEPLVPEQIRLPWWSPVGLHRGCTLEYFGHCTKLNNAHSSCWLIIILMSILSFVYICDILIKFYSSTLLSMMDSLRVAALVSHGVGLTEIRDEPRSPRLPIMAICWAQWADLPS